MTRATNHLIPSAADGQPQIDKDLALLASRYEHDGLMLDLYGTNTPRRIRVLDIALAGQTVSLNCLISDIQAAQMSEWCERQAKFDARKRHKDNAVDQAYLAMHGKRV